MCWGPCGPVDVVEMLGPCGPLVCWGYPCRGVLHTPHRAPPSVANTRPRVPVRPGVSPRAMVRRPYRPLRVRPIRALRPGWGGVFNTPRGFAARGFAPGYGPPGLQPGRVRPIRALRPVWWAYAIRPYRGTCIRVPSGTRPNSPASADAPARFAGVRRRPEASETLKQLVWAFPRPRIP